MFKRLKERTNRIKGNDIFISYTRADSLDYALAMANLLSSEQYFCFLDQFHNHPGAEIPKSLLDALHSSSALVLILSPKAFHSKAMHQEVVEFKKTGRLIIPIKIGDIEDLGMYDELLKGLAITPEEKSAWENSKPSKKIITRIIGSFVYRKRIKVLRNVAAATMAIIIAGISVGIAYSYLLKKDIDSLEGDKTELVNQKISLEIQAKDLTDSINTTNGLIAERNDEIVQLDSSLSFVNKDLQESRLALKESRQVLNRLNDSAQSLYASNLIGLLKNEELRNPTIFSNDFNPFNINRRMLLAIESYKINRNIDAESILNNNISFLGAQRFKRVFDDRVIDMAMSFPSFSENYFAVLLENGHVFLSTANKTFVLNKLVNIPQASKLIFLNSDQLLLVKSFREKSEIIIYNHKTGEKSSFVVPLSCKKLDFDESKSHLYLLSYNGDLMCYDLKVMESVFTETGLLDFAIHKSDKDFSSTSLRETNEMALWKGDTIYRFDIKDSTRTEKNKTYLPYTLFSKIDYSPGGNFVANGTDLAGLNHGDPIDKMYFERNFDYRFFNVKEETFSYGLGIGNVGFGKLDGEIYFSSKVGGENVIHYMEMYSFAAKVREKFRILSPTEITKLHFDVFDNVLFAIDINGHLVAWNLSAIWELEEDRSQLKGDVLIDEMCKRLLVNLTKEEWDYYVTDRPYCKTCSELN